MTSALIFRLSFCSGDKRFQHVQLLSDAELMNFHHRSNLIVRHNKKLVAIYALSISLCTGSALINDRLVPSINLSRAECEHKKKKNEKRKTISKTNNRNKNVTPFNGSKSEASKDDCLQ